MQSIGDLAGDASYAISDLLDENQWEHFDGLADVGKVQFRYLHGDCDDFALVLHHITSWPVYSVLSPSRGPLHRLVMAPDGRLLDAAGWVSAEQLAKRYGADDLVICGPGGQEFCQSSIGDDEDTWPVVAAILQFPLDPFSTTLRDSAITFASSVGMTHPFPAIVVDPIFVEAPGAAPRRPRP